MVTDELNATVNHARMDLDRDLNNIIMTLDDLSDYASRTSKVLSEIPKNKVEHIRSGYFGYGMTGIGTVIDSKVASLRRDMAHIETCLATLRVVNMIEKP